MPVNRVNKLLLYLRDLNPANEDVLKSMLLAKLKIAAAVAFVVSVLGGGLLVPFVFSEPPGERRGVSSSQAAKAPVLTDRYGDPLPPGALLRLGTVRMRSTASQFMFLPGNQLLSVGGQGDNLGQVWDLNTGRLVRQLEAGNIYPSGLALTADGKTIALTYTDQDKVTFLFLDTGTGKQVRRYEMAAHKVIYPLVFMPDGRTLAGWCDDEMIRLWDAATGREIRRMNGRQPFVHRMALSPDGQTLASAGRDRTIRLWVVQTGAERHRLEGVPDLTRSLAFAPDGATLASTGDKDNTIRLWDVKTGKLRQQLEGHSDPVYATAFSPDGKLLASSDSRDFSIRLWDAGTGRQLRRLDYGSIGLCLAFSADSKTLVVRGSDRTIRLWNTAAWEEIRPRGENQSGVYSVAYSPDGKILATGSSDTAVRLWDASTGALLQRFPVKAGSVPRVLFSPDGKTLALACFDNTVRLLDRTTGKELHLFTLSKGPLRYGLTMAAFSPDGKTLATAGQDRAIRLWSVRTGEPLRRIDRQADIRPIAFSPDGRFLASGESENTLFANKCSVHLWDAATGREVRQWPLNKKYVDTLAFSPDGSALAATGAFSSPIYLWDVANGELRAQLEIEPPKLRGIERKPRTLALAFSPDGKTLAVNNEIDHLIYLLETLTGKERARFAGHQDIIQSLAFSPDGRRLASGSWDTTALVWDATGLPATARGERLSAEQVPALWADLAGKDARKAFEAVGLLTAFPEQAIPFLKSKLRPAPEPAERQQVARLIADLENDDFSVRDRAMEQLRQLGDRAEPALTEALKNKPGLETRKRIEELLERIRSLSSSPERLRELRAIEVLEHIGTAEARQVLKMLADGGSYARLTREAQASLKRLEQR